MKDAAFSETGKRLLHRRVNSHFMVMKIFLTVLLCSICIVNAHASESCGMEAARLFANGQHRELAERFVADRNTVEELGLAFQYTGEITELASASDPRFTAYRRIRIAPQPALLGKQYGAEWVDAESAKIGQIQFQFAIAPGTRCKIMAMMIDTQAGSAVGNDRST